MITCNVYIDIRCIRMYVHQQILHRYVIDVEGYTSMPIV